VKKTRSCWGVRPCWPRDGKEIAELFRLLGVVALIRLEMISPSAEASVYLQVVLPTSMPQILAPLLWADQFSSRDLNAAWRLQKRRDLDKSLVAIRTPC